MLKTCKFCGTVERQLDRKGRPAHINRDDLCAPCYNLLERIKRTPDRVTPEEQAWFDDMCEANRAQRRRVEEMQRQAKAVGMRYTGPEKRFVPIAQRRVWACAHCGLSDERRRDIHYKRYCAACADTVRHHRSMPAKANRKERSDKGLERGHRA